MDPTSFPCLVLGGCHPWEAGHGHTVPARSPPALHRLLGLGLRGLRRHGHLGVLASPHCSLASQSSHWLCMELSTCLLEKRNRTVCVRACMWGEHKPVSLKPPHRQVTMSDIKWGHPGGWPRPAGSPSPGNQDGGLPGGGRAGVSGFPAQVRPRSWRRLQHQQRVGVGRGSGTHTLEQSHEVCFPRSQHSATRRVPRLGRGGGCLERAPGSGEGG